MGHDKLLIDFGDQSFQFLTFKENERELEKRLPLERKQARKLPNHTSAADRHFLDDKLSPCKSIMMTQIIIVFGFFLLRFHHFVFITFFGCASRDETNKKGIKKE